MKKIALLLVVTMAMILTGCEGYSTGKEVEDGAWKVVGQHGNYDLLRDTSTGCTYLQTVLISGSISPYYGEDGKVVGCGETDFDSKKYE